MTASSASAVPPTVPTTTELPPSTTVTTGTETATANATVTSATQLSTTSPASTWPPATTTTAAPAADGLRFTSVLQPGTPSARADLQRAIASIAGTSADAIELDVRVLPNGTTLVTFSVASTAANAGLAADRLERATESEWRRVGLSAPVVSQSVSSSGAAKDAEEPSGLPTYAYGIIAGLVLLLAGAASFAVSKLRRSRAASATRKTALDNAMGEGGPYELDLVSNRV